jgi:hypothetical protein
VKRCHGEDTLGVALRENSSMPSLILEREREVDNLVIRLPLPFSPFFFVYMAIAICIRDSHKIIDPKNIAAGVARRYIFGVY